MKTFLFRWKTSSVIKLMHECWNLDLLHILYMKRAVAAVIFYTQFLAPYLTVTLKLLLLIGYAVIILMCIGLIL